MMPSALPDPADCHYQSCYCEENIWHLCQQPFANNSEVIFISAKGEAFPVLNQQSASSPETPVLWDYHVVLLLTGAADTQQHPQVLDFDSTLPFGVNAITYFETCFFDEMMLDTEYVPLFRIVNARDYTDTFYSDRSHMRTPDGWNAPPPPWKPVSITGKTGSNLSSFTDMHQHEIGNILTRQQLITHLNTNT